MPHAVGNRFTIFDALEKKGYYSSNPANSYARDPTDGHNLYTGPVEFPKMLYHPQGEERIITQAEIVTTPMGAKLVGEKRELIYVSVENEARLNEALYDGWHDHPSKANRARIEARLAAGEIKEAEAAAMIKALPSLGSESRIKELEAQLAKLQGEKDREEARKETQRPILSAKAPAPSGTGQRPSAA